MECWYSTSAFPAPSSLCQVDNLLFCSQSLSLPGAKTILKVGQKGGLTISQQLRPLLLTHLGFCCLSPSPLQHTVWPPSRSSSPWPPHNTQTFSAAIGKLTWDMGIMTRWGRKRQIVWAVMDTCDNNLPLEEPLRPQGASPSSKR